VRTTMDTSKTNRRAFLLAAAALTALSLSAPGCSKH